MIDDERPRRARELSGEPIAYDPPPRPGDAELGGRFARLERLDPRRHGDDLWAVVNDPGNDASWDYLAVGPWRAEADYRAYLEAQAVSSDPLFYAIRDLATDRAVGVASYLRIDPAAGSIEIGHLWFSPALQRTPTATESIFLLGRHAFDGLGYRRLEWKCNALNAPSRRAARRFGFTYEGTFFRHLIVKGCNRDTAWYSILAEEWPAIRVNFETWLASDNFDADGRQKVALGELNGAG